MNRLTRCLVRLYPALWRQRYKAEFDALLEDVDPTWRSSLDILKGAISMQLRAFGFSNVVIITSFAGLLLGLSAYWFIPNRYVSTAIIHLDFEPEVPSEVYVQRVTSMTRNALSNARLMILIQRYDLYHEQLKRAPFADVLAEMKENIKLSPSAFSGERNLVKIEFTYRDPALAQQVLQDLTEILIKPPFDVPGPGGEILDAPNRDTSPISPNWKPLAFIGLIAGLLSGVLLAFILRRKPQPT